MNVRVTATALSEVKITYNNFRLLFGPNLTHRISLGSSDTHPAN